MKLIRLTTIERRAIAIAPSEIVSIEKGNYTDKYGLKGLPTRIIMKHLDYSVREDFETVCALVEGAEDDVYVYEIPLPNYCRDCGAKMKRARDYERATEQVEHDTLYEPTYNSEDGSM